MSDKGSKSWSWRHALLKSDLPATTRHVLLTISCFMNDVGQGCYPTQEQLATATGLTERAVRKHIDDAEKAGWIKRREHGFRGQKWRNHEYEAAWPDAQDIDQPEQGLEEGAERGSGPFSEGAESDDKKVRNEVPPILPVHPSKAAAAREDRYEGLLDQLLEAAGISGFRDEKSPQLMNLAPIMGLIEAGFDFKTDILPAIRERCASGFRPRSWSYFVEIVRERAGVRREAASIPKTNAAQAVRDWPDERWQRILDYSRNRGEWLNTYGPPPFADGCLVPEHLLHDSDKNLTRVAA